LIFCSVATADFKPIPGGAKPPTTTTTPSAQTVEAVAAEEYQTLERTLERMVDIRPVLGWFLYFSNVFVL